MIQIILMTPNLIEQYADVLLKDIERALGRVKSGNSPVGVLTRALRCDILTWGAVDGPEFLGHMTAYEKDGDLVILTLGGRRGKEWVPMMSEVVRELLDEGHYGSAITSARPGMAKWLKALGWKTQRSIMELA